MPEAPIDKHRDLETGPGKVRAPFGTPLSAVAA